MFLYNEEGGSKRKKSAIKKKIQDGWEPVLFSLFFIRRTKFSFVSLLFCIQEVEKMNQKKHSSGRAAKEQKKYRIHTYETHLMIISVFMSPN
jgi:hypothetical protein